jgi:hypothetical protein
MVIRWTALVVIASLVLVGIGPAASAQVVDPVGPRLPAAEAQPPTGTEVGGPAEAEALPQSSAPEITASAVVVHRGDPVTITLKNGLPGHKGYFREVNAHLQFYCGGKWQDRCEQQIDYRGSDLTIQARWSFYWESDPQNTYEGIFSFYDTTTGSQLPAGVWVRFYDHTRPDPPPPLQPELDRPIFGGQPFGGFYLEGISVDGGVYLCVDLKKQTGYVEFRLNDTPVYQKTVTDHDCVHFRFDMGDLYHAGSGVKTPKPINGQYTLQATGYSPYGATKTETVSYIQVPFKAEWFKDMVWLQPVAFHQGGNPTYDLAVKLPLKKYSFASPGFIHNSSTTGTSAGFDFKGVLSFPVKCQENYAIKASASVDTSFATVYIFEATGDAHGDSQIALVFRGCQLLGAQINGDFFAGGKADANKSVDFVDLLVDFFLDPGWANEVVKAIVKVIGDPKATVYGKLDLAPGLNASATVSPISPYLTSSARFGGDLILWSNVNVSNLGGMNELSYTLNGKGNARFDKDGLHDVGNLLFKAALSYSTGLRVRVAWIDVYNTGTAGICEFPSPKPNESCRKGTAAGVADLAAGQYTLIAHPSGDGYAVFRGPAQAGSWTAAPAVTALHPMTDVLVSNVFTYTTNALAVDPTTGQALLVWDHDDIGKPLGESMELRFSEWDGANWSMPAAVTADAWQDMAPQVAWTTNGQAVAVWHRASQAVSATGTVDAGFMNGVEIASATYDSATHAWSAPQLLTTNQIADFAPSLARSPDDRLLAAWQQYETMSGLEQAAPGRVMAAFYDGGWGAPMAAVADVAQLSEVAAGYGDDRATIAYTRAVTPTGTVTPTRQIWTTAWDGAAWAAPHQLTDDTLDHKHLNVLYNAQDEPLLVWLAGDVLTLRNLTSGFTASYPLDAGFGIQDELRAVQDGHGNIAAVFRDQISHADLHAAYFDAAHGVWGRPRPLTADTALERSPAPAFDADGRLQVAYGATAMHDEEVALPGATGETVTVTLPTAGQTDLNLLRYTFDRNLTVLTDSLALSDANPIPGRVVMVSGTVVNTGDLPLEGVTVSFYDGDPAADGVFVGTSAAPVVLPAGASATLAVPYLALAEGGIRTFYAVADAANPLPETDESENRAHLRALGADLAVVETWADPDVLGRTFVATAVRNTGTTTTLPTTVQLHRDAITGTVAATATVPAISPGGVYTAVVLWDHSTLPAGDVHLVAEVNEEDFDELNRANNVARLSVAAGPDLALSPYELTVGDLALASVPVTLTLRNTGAVTATDIALAFHNGWALDNTTHLMTHTVASLAGGSATRVVVTLPGPLSCGLYIQADNQMGRDIEWGNNLISLPAAAWCAHRVYLPVVYRGVE